MRALIDRTGMAYVDETRWADVAAEWADSDATTSLPDAVAVRTVDVVVHGVVHRAMAVSSEMERLLNRDAASCTRPGRG